jgi:hypothetical protein
MMIGAGDSESDDIKGVGGGLHRDERAAASQE